MCADYGIDPARPGRIYLVILEEREIMKVGIQNTGRKSDRLAIHKRRGWKEVDHWDVASGALARTVEVAVLKSWSEAGAVFVSPDEVPAGDGASESVRIGPVDIPKTVRLIERALSEEKSL